MELHSYNYVVYYDILTYSGLAKYGIIWMQKAEKYKQKYMVAKGFQD